MKGEILSVNKIKDTTTAEVYYEIAVKVDNWPTFLENDKVEMRQGNDDAKQKGSKKNKKAGIYTYC